MKQLFIVMAVALYCNAAAQTDPQPGSDSIRVGNMVIIKKAERNSGRENSEKKKMQADTMPAKNKDSIRIGNMIIITNGEKKNNDKEAVIEERKKRKHRDRPSNVSTNWIILDLGFANYNDKTNYGNTGGYLFQRPGTAPLGESDFNLNMGKSIDVNIWLFMQRLNLADNHLNLKYGIGIELNNYRYKSQVSYLTDNPFITGVAPAPVIIRDSVSFSKNKLATDYVTVPLMLNYCTNPFSQNRGFSLSLGVSGGYLYSSRNKQISAPRGKQVNNGGFDIKQFKFSYTGEIGLGPVRLYGSYSPATIYKRGLDIRPYTLGIRLSNW